MPASFPVLRAVAIDATDARAVAEFYRELAAQRDRAVSLGASVLQDRSTDPDEPPYVFADPADHPFCIFVSPDHPS